MSLISNEFLQITEEAKRRLAMQCDPLGAGVREWLVRGGAYYVSTSSKKALQVNAIDDSWSSANGSDAARFFWAARESVLPRSAPAYDERSTGWAAISIYYAGFYIAHGILRLLGHGMMYLTSDDCSTLAAAPGTTKLDRGVYVLSMQAGSPSTIALTKVNTSGFHEAFWRFVDNSFEVAGTDIAAGGALFRAFSSATRAAAFLSAEKLRAWLGTTGAVGREIGWMSSLRNEINYRLTRNLWAPSYREGDVTVARLRSDVLAIIRGTRDHIGARLRMDQDVRTMIERVCTLYRDLSVLSDFPAI